jgi:hypothetical protein
MLVSFMAGRGAQWKVLLGCDKVCRMAHSCDTFVVSSLISVISVHLKNYLTTSRFWSIEEESSDTTKWDNRRLRLAMPSSIYPMVHFCRSIEPPAVSRILSLD